MISGMVAVARWGMEPPARTTMRGTPRSAAAVEHQVADGEVGRLGEAQGAVVIPVGVEAVIPDEQVRLERRDQGQVPAHQVDVLGIRIFPASSSGGR